MPLFHIHGLIAGLCAPLSRGGSVFCTPGFNALKFFADMEEAKPTWYTAVPTMHQTILTRAARNREVIARHPAALRALLVVVAAPDRDRRTRGVFKCPVIEAYGMTEAAHQMASNPAQRRAQAGLRRPRRRARDRDHGRPGRLLGRGEMGEVVIRGDNVTAGYENNAKANGEAFVDGWFRTGDQGVIDSDGYLTLTGRLKEIINRGGEKISPARGRRSADGPSRRPAGGRLRGAPSDAGRGCRRRGRPARGPDRDRAGTARFLSASAWRRSRRRARSCSSPRSPKARPGNSSASASRRSWDWGEARAGRRGGAYGPKLSVRRFTLVGSAIMPCRARRLSQGARS